MKQREFYVIGYGPAYGKQANDLIKRLDLGTEGAFVSIFEKATVALNDDVTEGQLARQSDAIKSAYEQMGYKDVIVVEVEL